MLIELSHEQMELLREILEHKRQEIASEINHTDHFDYKVRLRQQEHMLEELLQQIMPQAA